MPCGIYWHRAELTLKWIARLWSIPSLILIVGLLYGSASRAPAISGSNDILGFLLAPGVICGGILLGWRWQGLGGIVCSVGFVAFYIVLRTQSLAFLWEPYFLSFAVPGMLFFASWLLECRNRWVIGIKRLSPSRRDDSAHVSRK